jgi:putative membrane protein
MKRFIKKIMGLGVIVGLLFETFPVWALVKDETIYAKLDNNGQVNKVIISEHLQGTGDKQTFDRSKLDEIKNVNGDEKFTNENGKLVWESNGKDIYYQGQTKEELPISLKISYFFNGKESTIKEMLGKKGTVKMVLKYSNNDKHEAYINGKYTTLYTPFVVATTTILSNTVNSNI